MIDPSKARSNCRHFPNASDHCLVCEAEDRIEASRAKRRDYLTCAAAVAVFVFVFLMQVWP